MTTEAGSISVPPAKRRKIDFTEDIVVLVGEWEKRFVVHTNILCASSNFLRKAVKGGWKEGEEKQVRLQEATASSFEIYITWLYTGALEICSEGEVKAYRTHCAILGEAAILGDFLEDRKFCNSLVHELMRIYYTVRRFPMLIYEAYEKLPSKSGFSRLLVDIYATYVSADWFESHVEGMPAAFVTDLAVAGLGSVT